MNPRQEAELLVAPHVNQYTAFNARGVPSAAAETLLGSQLFARLQRDPVRKHGPVTGTVYPWNIVDYLANPKLNEQWDAKPAEKASSMTPEYLVFQDVGDYGLAYLRSTTPAMNEMFIDDPQGRPPARFKSYDQAKAAAETCCGYVMAVDPEWPQPEGTARE